MIEDAKEMEINSFLDMISEVISLFEFNFSMHLIYYCSKFNFSMHLIYYCSNIERY